MKKYTVEGRLMEQRRGKGQDLRYLSRRRKLDSLSTELYIFVIMCLCVKLRQRLFSGNTFLSTINVLQYPGHELKCPG